MKKRFIACALAMGTLLTVTGCGQPEEVVPDTQEIIEVSLSTNIKSPLDMTKDELKALSPTEIKEMIEVYLPNYRTVYGIEPDFVMQDNDWMNLRDMIIYQLYGEIVNSVHDEMVSGIDWSKPFEIDAGDGSYYDPDWIYYAPCPEYINGLTLSGFAQYMNGFMEYNGYALSDADDFSYRTSDELEELRIMILTDLCKEWGTVDIPSVKELEAAYQQSIIDDIADDAGLEQEEVQEEETEQEEEVTVSEE